jgi:hypothetical protein
MEVAYPRRYYLSGEDTLVVGSCCSPPVCGPIPPECPTEGTFVETAMHSERLVQAGRRQGGPAVLTDLRGRALRAGGGTDARTAISKSPGIRIRWSRGVTPSSAMVLIDD